MKPPRVVVLGFMGACPIAGVLWQHLHYIESLRRLGADVWYVEDTSRYPYNPVTFDTSGDYAYAAESIAAVMAKCQLPDRWGYVAGHLPEGGGAGLDPVKARALIREADVVLNVCGSHDLTPDMQAARCLVYVESDPGVEQIKVAKGDAHTIAFLRAHHHLFTFGEWIPAGKFVVPTPEFTWLPTRQPVVVDFWQEGAAPIQRNCYSTIANWSTSGQKDIEWESERYLWSKSLEFLKFCETPRLAGVSVEMATDIKDAKTASRFTENDWTLALPHELSVGTTDYCEYIRASRGEFTVAKDQYVRLKTGWFSDRSACYLAAGRPVITQETGFSEVYGRPAGGLLGYGSVEEAVEALRRVEQNYSYHAEQATKVAREIFEGTKVLGDLLARI